MDSTIITAVSAVLTAVATGVMIWAVYAAPQKAFEARWKLQELKEARDRRLLVFKSLMATRGNALNARHVEALNLIDVEFADPVEKDVRDAWKAYLDHLKTYGDITEPDESKRKELENQREEHRRDLLAELLQKMGARLGYGFDFTYLKGRAYYPIAYQHENDEQSSVRKGLIEILWKGRPLMVRGIMPPVALPEEKKK